MSYGTITFAASGWSNVQQGNGVAIALTGMIIVFVALSLISLFITALPRLLDSIAPYLPRIEDHAQAPSPEESTLIDEQSVVAAVGYVLHTETQKAMKNERRTA